VPKRSVASRYAEALFEVARGRGAVEAVRKELEALLGLAEATPALRALLERPDLGADQKLEALRSAFGDEVSDIVVALLDALLERGRGDHVAEVAAVYDELADDAAGLVRAEARTAAPLTDSQRERLVAALGRITERQVKLEERIDPEVLAGVRVLVGDRLIDGSAAGRLERMREQLMSVRGTGR
jgi:F-type H+-transporting ATPase subunit delta